MGGLSPQHRHNVKHCRNWHRKLAFLWDMDKDRAQRGLYITPTWAVYFQECLRGDPPGSPCQNIPSCPFWADSSHSFCADDPS